MVGWKEGAGLRERVSKIIPAKEGRARGSGSEGGRRRGTSGLRTQLLRAGA